MATTVVVRGEAALESSLATASKQIADLRDGFGKASQIITAAAQAGAPRRSGRLAGSVAARVSGRNAATITSPLVYAVPIHWGRPAHNIAANPFVVRAANTTEHEWVAAIEADAQRVCDKVHGA